MSTRADLVVIKGTTVVFSNWMSKPNNTAVQIDLARFVDVGDSKRLIIPIGFENVYVVNNNRLDPMSDTVFQKNGPMALSIHNGLVSEYRMNKNERELCSFFNQTNNDTFYSRSNGYYLESASMAAGFIYDDPVKIYRESYKALNLTPYPFYSGDIFHISTYIEHLYEVYEKNCRRLNNVMDLLKSNPSPENNKELLERKKEMKTLLECFRNDMTTKSLVDLLDLTLHD